MSTPHPGLIPFVTADEARRARRRRTTSAIIAALAVVLAVVAERTVGDPDLVTVYAVAAFLHALDVVFTSLRLAATPD